MRGSADALRLCEHAFRLPDWTLEVRADGVTFASFGQSQVVFLPREQFLVAGRWPGPEPKA